LPLACSSHSQECDIVLSGGLLRASVDEFVSVETLKAIYKSLTPHSASCGSHNCLKVQSMYYDLTRSLFKDLTQNNRDNSFSLQVWESQLKKYAIASPPNGYGSATDAEKSPTERDQLLGVAVLEQNRVI
jgi:hypothetical protein